MKAKTFILTFLTGMILTVPVYASPEYSEETKRLMQEAGLGQEYTVDEIMARQEALKSGQATNDTPTTKKSLKTSQKSLKGANDEFHIANGTGQDTVKVTDTDDLHIYSNDYADGYANAYYGAKNSWDEFHTAPYDIGANDGYDESTWGQLHINENYRKNVYYEPEKDKNRLGIDEYRLPWQMN